VVVRRARAEGLANGGARSDDRLVVSICGPSGSGKSQLAEALVVGLGEEVAVRVPADYYLAPAPADGTLTDYFASPLDYDWAALERAVSLPEGTATSTPDFDFESFRRVAETGGRPFVLRRLVFVDAIYPAPFADATIALDPPDDVRRARIVERDERWGTNVIGRWAHLELATARLRSLNVAYDLKLAGTDDIDRTAQLVTAWLLDRYAPLVRR
jgi:uridine kinase